MYEMTSLPFVRRTFATLRMAEFGFLGVRVITCTHTPRRNGLPSKAGDFDLVRTLRRPFRTSWLMVGMRVVESENWRKEENATKPKKLGKNFLGKSTKTLRELVTAHRVRSC
jgi:hypothetical protein